MATKSKLFLLVCLTCLSLDLVSASFQYLKLVQQWPPSVCNTPRKQCQPPQALLPVNFTVHGLWPDNFTGPFPISCNPRLTFLKFNDRAFEQRLTIGWPNIEDQTNHEKFWIHEWMKHGTCSASLFNQRQYFEVAMFWKDKFDLFKILDNNGVHRGMQHYPISLINTTIITAIQGVPDLLCSINSAGQNQIVEIGICLDHSAVNVIDCPYYRRRSRTCRNPTHFPAKSPLIT